MARRVSTLRSARALLSVRFVLEQIGLALLVFALCILWLRLPDASVLEVIVTVLLGGVVLFVAGAGESWLILRLAGRQRTRKQLLRGALLLLLGVALYFGWSALLDHIRGNHDDLRAGYWNSRFPHAWRTIFSFPHILLWLSWLWAALQWIGSGVIAIFIFTAIAALHPIRAGLRALRSITYWVLLIFGTTFATVITGSLVSWTPGHGLGIEMLSLILRLSLAVLVDAAVVCLLLATLAVCSKDAAGSRETGTP